MKEVNRNNYVIKVGEENHIWHSPLCLRTTNGKTICRLRENPAGCGSLIMHDFADNMKFVPFVESIDDFLSQIARNRGKVYSSSNSNIRTTVDVGAIMTVVGDAHLDVAEPLLDELGFKKISTYDNLRHDTDGKYKQYLFVWTV